MLSSLNNTDNENRQYLNPIWSRQTQTILLRLASALIHELKTRDGRVSQTNYVKVL